MAISPQVLPGRAFAQTTPVSSLLFHWRAQSRDLVTVDRLSTGTLTRASAGGLTDGRGHRTANALTDVRLVGPAADNQARWGVSTAGVPHLLLEDTRTNFQPIANPTTGWQTSSALSTGSETTVAPDGTLVPLLVHRSTAVNQFMQQDVEVASTVAITSWYAKSGGTTIARTLRLFDNSTAASRGEVRYTFGSTGAMTITTTSAGTVIAGPDHIGNNWWKTSLECTGISTGNDNQLGIFPTFDGSTGGDMFIAHIQVEDVASTGLFASSHVPTVSAAVTRAAETLNWPFLPVPQEMTVYIKFIERGSILTGTTTRILQIGDTSGNVPSLYVANNASGVYQAITTNAAASAVSSTPSASPSVGDVVELRVTLGSDGKIQIGQSINGAAEILGAQSAANVLGSAWSGQLVSINSLGATLVGFTGCQSIKIAPGTLTMAQCRETF